MHILVRELCSLDEQAPAEDLCHEPADIVFLSFSDNDLNVMRKCLQKLPDDFPSIQLAPLTRLQHPMSVDLYLDQTVSRSKFVILRLLGGKEAWKYGTDELVTLCNTHNIPFVILSGGNHDHPELDRLCTVPPFLVLQFKRCFHAGGISGFTHILKLAASHVNQQAIHPVMLQTLPMVGEHQFDLPETATQKLAIILFYRAHLLAGNIDPILETARKLSTNGLRVKGVYVNSLKEPETALWVKEFLQKESPSILLNTTYFSVQQEVLSSLFRPVDVPVLQVLQPGNTRKLWENSFRGLSQTDLAIQVVLPELDGKLLTTAIGFKKETNGQVRYDPYPAGIDLVVKRVMGWVTLASKTNQDKKIAIILSNYPGVGGQEGHAVGLDSFASLYHILQWLKNTGYQTGTTLPTSSELVQALCKASPQATLSLAEYRKLFSELPAEFQKKVLLHWPNAGQDETLYQGSFTLRYLRLGNILCAIQPERATASDHKSAYHDPDIPPAHGYIATYLWLQKVFGMDAIIHLGTHGTMEWLPGKATAISESCSSTILIQGVPVIYPFIVNNPGEAACAKRRLGAVTIGHMTPPVNKAVLSGSAAELERLIDDYAEADGLDHRRSRLLLGSILDKAESCGLLAETGINRQETGDEIALNHLDAYLCDVKDLQIREGLHVFGTPPSRFQSLLDTLKTYAPDQEATLKTKLELCAEQEKNALLNALDGKFISPGPAGAPTRGRLDVLPTGRNLYSIDPRGIPTRTAYLLAEKTAEQLLLRYMQEQGDHLRHLVLDLWGSTNLRTGGEDLALAYILMGARPIWDECSNRVKTIEILPLATLNRPRVDVTLRISGLFRDAFEDQIILFDQTVKALAERPESQEWNPLAHFYQTLSTQGSAHPPNRIYGTAQRTYGTGMEFSLSSGNWQDQKELGETWLENSSYSYGNRQQGVYDKKGLAERLKHSQAFFHSQDHAETDLLDSPDYATHEGGFAAAANLFGNTPVLYHADTSRTESPRIRLLVEEVNRITRGRVANPAWITSMMRHSYRGAAEIARSIDALFSFSATLSHRFDPQFDLVFSATLGNPEVMNFLSHENPAAYHSIVNRFKEACKRDLWHPKSNSVMQVLDQADE